MSRETEANAHWQPDFAGRTRVAGSALGPGNFDSLDHAAQRARALRFGLGAWAVLLAIPDGSAIEWAQTGKDSRHFTIYTVPFEALTLVEGDAIYVGDE